MATNYQMRYATNPEHINSSYDTQQIRDHFLIDKIFSAGEINLLYTHYDRFIVGGAKPDGNALKLESIDPLKTEHFLDRRELGVVNVGEKGMVTVDGEGFELDYKEALYIGKDVKEVTFEQKNGGQSLFYLNSASAHKSFPTKKVGREDAEVVELGSLEKSNHRVIRKLIVNSIVNTCQLQIGMTELREGSVWNTMPCHIHNRRMETYFYFELEEDEVVSHFLGEPKDTRHIWMKNNQAVLSPPWSIHCGAGISNYTFIWGMAGENLDYDDKDECDSTKLR